MDSALHACLCASDSFRYWKAPIPSGKIQLNFQWMWKWVTACELPWVRFLTFLMNAIACTWMHWRSKMNSECYLHFDRFHFNWNQCNFQSSSGNSFEWKYCTDSGLNEIRNIPCIKIIEYSRLLQWLLLKSLAVRIFQLFKTWLKWFPWFLWKFWRKLIRP